LAHYASLYDNSSRYALYSAYTFQAKAGWLATAVRGIVGVPRYLASVAADWLKRPIRSFNVQQAVSFEYDATAAVDRFKFVDSDICGCGVETGGIGGIVRGRAIENPRNEDPTGRDRLCGVVLDAGKQLSCAWTLRVYGLFFPRNYRRGHLYPDAFANLVADNYAVFRQRSTYTVTNVAPNSRASTVASGECGRNTCETSSSSTPCTA
jgi:hypothetical protein